MHIAEGVLSAPVILSGAALSIGAVGYGLRKLPQDNLILAGLVGAAFFVASLIHVPVGFSSAHLILNGLVGIVLGWAAYPVIFVALLLQAVLFMFGGLTTLGVNTFTMGTGALLAGALYRTIARRSDAAVLRNDAAAFIAGCSGVLISAFLTALALAFTSEGFAVAAAALFTAHLPIMAAEGVLTVLVVRYLRRSGNPLVLQGLH